MAVHYRSINFVLCLVEVADFKSKERPFLRGSYFVGELVFLQQFLHCPAQSQQLGIFK